MIDHISLQVSDLKKSKHFYDNVLVPIGYEKLMEAPKENAMGAMFYGWGDSVKTDFWITEGLQNEPRLHIAFRADNRQQVEEFYKSAIAAGGICNGKPGVRPEYHESYFGAFVLDPDGHNIEAVCHVPMEVFEQRYSL